MPDSPECSSQLRWSVYGLLIALSVGSLLGRILAVNSVDKVALENKLVQDEVTRRTKQLESKGEAVDAKALERQVRLEKPKLLQQRPFLSANDRSRWAAVRSLVEHGTYAIDDIISQPNWDTIDMVKHADREGVPHLYSSKPPLFSTLMAGEYWIIHRLTGATLGTHPYEIGRFMLVTINVIPLVIYFVLLAKLAERLATTDWARLFMFSAAAFATFLTTFAVSINNHLPAAISALVAVYAAIRIWYDGQRQWWLFALAGFFAAFTVPNELPALSFFAVLTAALLWRAPRRTLSAYLPAALVVVAAYFGTNYIAHGSWREPYAHRSATDPEDNWYHYTYERDGKVRDSYWLHPVGIDRGEPSRGAYVLHALVGHHGIFSLTPIWLLSVVGLAMWLRDPRRRELAFLIGSVSLVCLAFYLLLPQLDRNYGGMTSGLRWMFWFTPLWLIALLPAADWLSISPARRGLGLVLLAASVLSASYPTWNPWVHPWIANYLTYLNWIQF